MLLLGRLLVVGGRQVQVEVGAGNPDRVDDDKLGGVGVEVFTEVVQAGSDFGGLRGPAMTMAA